MKKRKIIYTDNPDLPDIEDLEIVEDFLPPPHELVFKYSKKKIALDLETNIIEFFKEHAKRLHSSYQQVIQDHLRSYVKEAKSPKKQAHA